MLIQRASTFSNPVVVADLAALSEKVEVKGCGYRDPQPSLTLSLSQTWLPFWGRLRIRDVDTESLSLK